MLTKAGIPYKCRVCKQRPCKGVNCPSIRNISGATRNCRKPAKVVRDQAYPLPYHPKPKTIRLKDVYGKEHRLTIGVLDDEAQLVLTNGHCVAFALAINKLTGWPIYEFNRSDGTYHVAVLPPPYADYEEPFYFDALGIFTGDQAEGAEEATYAMRNSLYDEDHADLATLVDRIIPFAQTALARLQEEEGIRHLQSKFTFEEMPF